MTINDDQKTDLVEMLESVTYLICQDDPVQPSQFCKVRMDDYFRKYVLCQNRENKLDKKIVERKCLTDTNHCKKAKLEKIIR